MFGSMLADKLILALLLVAFVVGAFAGPSIWLTVLFGLLAAVQAVGVVADITNIWRK